MQERFKPNIAQLNEGKVKGLDANMKILGKFLGIWSEVETINLYFCYNSNYKNMKELF